MKIHVSILGFIFFCGSLCAQTALYFDGVNDYLPVKGTSKLNSLTRITLETWLYVKSFNSSPCADCAPIIWNQQNSYRFSTGNTAKVNISILNGSTTVSISSAKTLSANAWHHIAATFSGTKLKIYIDGVATDSATYSNFNIGYSSSSSDVWVVDPVTGFGGILEETRIWDYARSPAEIKEGMLRHYPSTQPGLVLQFSYEDGTAYADNTSVSTVKDGSKFGHDGTPGNFAMKDSISNFVLGRSYCDTTAYAKFSVTQCVKYQLPSKKKFVSSSGVYQDTIVSYRGCDSVMTITVKILKASASSFALANCDSVQNPITKSYYKRTGKYTTTIQNYLGCDSTVTFNVTVYKKDTSLVVVDICNSFKLGSGKTVTTTGIYVDSLKGMHGCDSFVYYNIKIRKSSTAKITLPMCHFVLCPSDPNVVYRNQGTYYDTITNAVNCDSFIEYNVVSKASNAVINVATCGTYTSPSKKYTWTSAGTYKDTMLFGNYQGCDSFMTINLSFITPAKQTFSVSRCGSYQVPSRTKWVYNSGTANDVLKDKNGCDSIQYTINVTILHATTTFTRSGNTLSATATAPQSKFQWLDCNNSFAKIPGETNRDFSPGKDGRYALEVQEDSCTDTSGCVNFIFNSLHKNDISYLSIYPNPAHSEISINSELELHHATITVHNLLGEKLRNFEYTQLKNASVFLDLPPAMYTLRLHSDEGDKVQYLLVE